MIHPRHGLNLAYLSGMKVVLLVLLCTTVLASAYVGPREPAALEEGASHIVVGKVVGVSTTIIDGPLGNVIYRTIALELDSIFKGIGCGRGDRIVVNAFIRYEKPHGFGFPQETSDIPKMGRRVQVYLSEDDEGRFKVLYPNGFAEPAPAAAVRSHLRNLFTLDPEKIAAGYASTVRLARGHEFLRPGHGLVSAGEKNSPSKPTEVPRKRYIAALLRAMGDDVPKGREIDRIITNSLIEADASEPVTCLRKIDPPGPVDGSVDGKLHLPVELGDVIVKFQPRENESLSYFHLRRHGDRWLIVGEFSPGS
ncbi:MAG: hypothetical protein ACR2RV_21045 [Verrucomicrobiales bacterium]